MRKSLLASLGLIMSFAFDSHAQTLLYYWDFNSSSDTAQHTAGYAPDYTQSSLSGGTFTFLPGTTCSWPTTAGCIDYTAGSYTNLQNGDTTAGTCLRLRTPADSVVFTMPTTGFLYPHFSYALQRSGSGPTTEYLYYTTDGSNFISVAGAGPGNSASIPVDSTTGWQLISIDFSGDPATYNNANFAVKISYGAYTAGGNNRFDNVALFGAAPAGVNEINQAGDASYTIFPNPASSNLQITSTTTGDKTLSVFNAIGQKVDEQHVSGTHFAVNVANLASGAYYVNIHETVSGSTTIKKFTKQ